MSEGPDTSRHCWQLCHQRRKSATFFLATKNARTPKTTHRRAHIIIGQFQPTLTCADPESLPEEVQLNQSVNVF